MRLLIVVIVLALPLMAQPPAKQPIQSEERAKQFSGLRDDGINQPAPNADPKDAQIGALTARIADLERRVKVLEEFRTKAIPILSLVFNPILELQQQLAQMDAKPKETK